MVKLNGKKIGKFKRGDRIIFRNAKSEHNGKPGHFIEETDSGKYRIEFEDGGKLVALAKNVFPNDEPISKDGVFIKLKSFPDGVKLKALDSNSIEIKNVLNLFPELNNIGFEVTGDDIAYTDDFLSIDELLEELRERGFTAHSV